MSLYDIDILSERSTQSGRVLVNRAPVKFKRLSFVEYAKVGTSATRGVIKHVGFVSIDRPFAAVERCRWRVQ